MYGLRGIGVFHPGGDHYDGIMSDGCKCDQGRWNLDTRVLSIVWGIQEESEIAVFVATHMLLPAWEKPELLIPQTNMLIYKELYYANTTLGAKRHQSTC